VTRYKLLASAAGLALAASITGTGSAHASSGLGTRTLENYMGGTCLSGGSGDGDQVVVSTSCTLSTNQGAIWTFSGAAGGYNTLKDGYNKCLDARDDSTHNPDQLGDPVQVWSCNGGNQQEWNVQVEFDSSDGTQYIRLINKASGRGYVLDARNDGNHFPTTSGDPMQLYQYNGTSNQQWGVLTAA
jgi:hypothetical protein